MKHIIITFIEDAQFCVIYLSLVLTGKVHEKKTLLRNSTGKTIN